MAEMGLEWGETENSDFHLNPVTCPDSLPLQVSRTMALEHLLPKPQPHLQDTGMGINLIPDCPCYQHYLAQSKSTFNKLLQVPG